MPPKSGKSPKTRTAEWLLCPQSGLLYHSSTQDLHSSWLASSSPCPAPHPHIRDSSTLHCRAALLPAAAVSPWLSARLAFSSVFLHPSTALQCGLGQASLVRVRVPGEQEVVVTMFTSPECPPTQVAATKHSWLAHLVQDMDPELLITVERFSSQVDMCRELDIEVEGDIDHVLAGEKEALKSSARYHLAGLVIPPAVSRVPFNYLGVETSLRVTPRMESADTVSRQLQNLRLGSEEGVSLSLVTSTPLKQPARDGEQVFHPSTAHFKVSTISKFVFVEKSVNVETPKPKFIGGLDKEIDTIVSHAKAEFSAEGSAARLVTGVLLHGPSGAGKTLLAESLPGRLGVPVVRVTGAEIFSKFYGETEKRLREKFDEARSAAPCVLLMDEVDSLAPRRDASGGQPSDQERRVAASLLTLLDSLHRDPRRVLVVGATCRLDGVEAGLRRPGRFDLEIEVAVPGVEQRREILRGKLGELDHDISDGKIDIAARDTHGFVGADIEALVGGAVILAREDGGRVTWDHLVRARARVKPSAMREVMVEVPQVTWRDIGGLDDLKLKLRQAVEWPIKHPEVFTRMGISAPKGLLMYGPPGCSKTMIAKALANESGLNFLSIKGPELFSKWVGESERAVREVFKKARQVKPSIVFFDEIDAVGGSRGGGGGGKVGDRVLAQLLTEMDGVESLAGVTVVAATNRPDMCDTALLRPGRLDRVVYVPLPDLDTRLRVLEVHTRNIPVSDQVNLESLAARTERYSGAEIAAVCNEAALAALEESVDAVAVNESHFETALSSLKPRISNELFVIYERFQSQHNNKAV